jgi:hypothetical protein
MRSLLSSPLVVVGKGLKLTQSLSRSSFEQREAKSVLSLSILCLVANLNRHKALARVLWQLLEGKNHPPNCGHLPGERGSDQRTSWNKAGFATSSAGRDRTPSQTAHRAAVPI